TMAAKRPIFRVYVKLSAPLWVTDGVGGSLAGVGGGCSGYDVEGGDGGAA
nr:hypothetical protein [Tanacetum cinerariifolium]